MTELELTHLGKQSIIETNPNKVVLDKIPNPNADTIYCCRFTIPEMSSLCPRTGQPDYATLIIDYCPRNHLLESKSLKLYIFAFRNHGSFHEDVTVSIGKRIYNLLGPRWLRIAGFWYARGGISIDVVWESGEVPEGARPLDIDNAIKPYSGRHG
jgi:7-cyano-7-deazaguanine reductase